MITLSRKTFASLVMILLVSGPLAAVAQQRAQTGGNVYYTKYPLCALVLINGASQFSCDGNGRYDLDVPVDKNGMITVQAFADGFAPVNKILTPQQAADYQITMSPAEDGLDFEVESEFVESQTEGRAILSGTVAVGKTPVCALVLANGQKMFSCEANMGKFSLDVPLDDNGNVTLMIFAAGFQPYKITTAGPAAPDKLAYVSTELATMASEGLANTPAVPVAAIVSATPQQREIEAIAREIVSDAENLALVPLAAETSNRTIHQGDCGGQYVLDALSTTGTGSNIYPLTTTVDGVLDSYCNGGATMDGTINLEQIIDFDYVYSSIVSDYTITFQGFSVDVSSTVICEGTDAGDLTCTTSYSTEFRGINYSLRTSKAVGNNASGYVVIGTLRDAAGNEYPVNANNLFFQCDDDNVSGGAITITNLDGDDILVSFPNCNDCVVDYRGQSTTYSQDP